MEEIKQVPYCGPTKFSRHDDLAPGIFVPLIQCALKSKVAELFKEYSLHLAQGS